MYCFLITFLYKNIDLILLLVHFIFLLNMGLRIDTEVRVAFKFSVVYDIH